MKRTALLTGVLCAISSGALAQRTASETVVIIPAFENRFATVHQPVVALNTVNRGSTFQVQTFGSSTDPASRGVVTSPTAAAPTRGQLDPTVMNIPVFPATPTVSVGALGPGQIAFPTFPPNVGFSGQPGVFIQQGGGRTLTEVDPFRTTATPGPAVNAVPNPAAPVPTIPQLQPTIGTTIPVQQQNPTILVPGQVVPGAVVNQGTPVQAQPLQTQPLQTQPLQTQPIGSGQNQNQNQFQSGGAQQNQNQSQPAAQPKR